jgi:hypothetical protein
MTAIALADEQLRQVMEIAEQIPTRSTRHLPRAASPPISVIAATATALSVMAMSTGRPLTPDDLGYAP